MSEIIPSLSGLYTSALLREIDQHLSRFGFVEEKGIKYLMCAPLQLVHYLSI